MVNQEIREELFRTKVRQWQVADELGIHEVSFIRKLRHELNVDEKERILQIVRELAATK